MISEVQVTRSHHPVPLPLARAACLGLRFARAVLGGRSSLGMEACARQHWLAARASHCPVRVYLGLLVPHDQLQGLGPNNPLQRATELIGG
jgi:hypothetical protein